MKVVVRGPRTVRGWSSVEVVVISRVLIIKDISIVLVPQLFFVLRMAKMRV